MNRQQKELVVKTLQDRLKKCEASFLVGYQGLTVKQMQSLRKNLRDKEARFQIAKARLIKRAVDAIDEFDELMPFLKDQIGIVFAKKEPIAVAKVLHEFAKKNEQLRLVVGTLDSNLIDQDAIIRLASLPSKEILLAQTCGVLKAPIVKLVIDLQMIMVMFLNALKQIAEKKK